MNRAFAAATIAGVLWHALAGCCAHHAHLDRRSENLKQASHLHASRESNVRECCRHRPIAEKSTRAMAAVDQGRAQSIGLECCAPLSNCTQAKCFQIAVEDAAKIPTYRCDAAVDWLRGLDELQTAEVRKSRNANIFRFCWPSLRTHLSLRILLI